jgi:hypothetical protein
MQSGIAYAAGQLLAVVAPRTVLVVDAPTDWSLAGPLWELALDDAPVDEILDVLVRRGIRTAPSFAIVRVEVDAVRALVRGSVPVCFERVGEPVRLDATGATTWLEGLISGARRVLVGAVETGSNLPYHVSTGVVLVSGLALACGPVDAEDRPSLIPGVAEQPALSSGGPGEGSATSSSEDPYFSPSGAMPVGAGASAGSSGSTGREPRVVDLTRTGPRTPAKAFSAVPRESWALASARTKSEPGTGNFGRSELNGHVPAVLEPLPIREPSPEPERPAAPSSSLFEPVGYAPSSTDDDPGELHDVEAAASTDYAGESSPSSFRSESEPRPSQFTSGFGGNGNSPSDFPRSVPPPPEDFSTDDEDPQGPSPADLPNLDLEPPTPINGRAAGVPAQPRGFNAGVPAAWPPVYDASTDQAEASPVSEPDAGRGFGGSGREDFPAWAPAPAQSGNGFDSSSSRYNAAPEPAPSAPENAEQPQPSIGDLPLRVRGRSLRPEHASTVNGTSNGVAPSAPASSNPMNGLSAVQEPSSPNPPPRPIAVPEPDSAPASGSLLLPAFFRGARAARSPADEINDSASAPAEIDDAPITMHDPWMPKPAGSSSGPAAWVPPVRRGFPDRSGSGFNGGPPAMPGVLRPVDPDSASAEDSDQHGSTDYGGYVEEATESYPPPNSRMDPETERIDDDLSEPHREPPRLLGVWCDAGHVTSPDRDECRVCGLAVPPQAPILVARPVLGVLIFDNGDRVEVDRPVVLGRDPKPNPSSVDPESPLLHAVTSATGQVSRTHAEIRASGWDVVLTDLGAMNGTALTLPGAAPVAIEAGVATVITPGARVDLGGESGFVFEVEG